MKKRIAALALALAIAAGAGGCARDKAELPSPENSPEVSSSPEPQEQRPEPIVSILSQDVKLALAYYPTLPLNPYTCDNVYNKNIGGLIYESLVSVSADYKVNSLLCTSWHSDDNVNWTFSLRKGVTFSDGSPLRTEDVVYSLQTAQLFGSYTSRFERVASIVAIDDTDVVVTLTKPNVFFARLMDVPIIPEGSGHDMLPLGTGPYKFAIEEGSYCLEANTSWWQSEDLPFERVELKSTEDTEQTLYDFQTGDVTLVTYDKTATGTVVYRDNCEKFQTGTTTMQYLGFNTDNFFTGESVVRRAILAGIDREFIAGEIFEGFAVPSVLPVSPYCEDYDEELAESVRYYSGVTAKMLHEAGFRDTDQDSVLERYRTKFTLDFIVNNENPYKLRAARLIAQQMREAGIDVTLRELDWEAFTAALNARTYDVYYGEIRLQKDFDLTSLLYSYASNNFGAYSNATADGMLISYLDGTATPSQLYEFLLESAPIAPILFKEQQVIAQRGLVKQIYATGWNTFSDFKQWRFNAASNDK